MTKPLLRALAGEAVWPPPAWLMRQAGRYLPEYREVRARTRGFVDLATTPALAAEVTLQPIRRYGMDGAILFSDILMIPWALGQRLDFAQGEGPVLPPIRDAAGVDALRPDRVATAIAPILETVERVRAGLADTATTLIGFAGGPWTVACYMVEGGSSRDFAHVRGLAFDQPALFARLIDVLTDATVSYLCAQVAAGAEAVMLFDTWAGLLPPSLFREHVIRPAARIAAGVRARHPTVPLIGFPRLAGTWLGAYAEAAGLQAVAMDSSVDPASMAAAVPGHVALQGNLDPFALLAGGEALARETDAILAAMRGRPFVFNLGHGVMQQTPPAHVAALMARLRAA